MPDLFQNHGANRASLAPLANSNRHSRRDGNGARWPLALLALLLTAPAFPQASSQADAENKELVQALQESGTSSIDILHTLEAFLKKYPNTVQRPMIERALARAAVDVKDDRLTILYGIPAVERAPDDVLLLDRVARALLNLGDRDNAEKSLKYSRAFEQSIRNAPPPEGRDSGRRQDERDRGIERALIYQARAKTVLGEDAEAERLASQAFSMFPAEEAAREWAEALVRLHREKDAVLHLADAFTVPDSHATDADRSSDRRLLGELYRKLHRNEKGLGDVVLEAYDRNASLVEERRKKLEAMDPNLSVSNPLQFTLTGVDGGKLALSALKGSVVVFDFWATWCQPCRIQHPLYEQVKQRFKDHRDVVFLSIDTDEDHSKVAPFLDEQKWSRMVYFEDGLQRLLQVTSIPTTVLFDKQGRVASRMNGFLPGSFVDQLSERIQSALEAR